MKRPFSKGITAALSLVVALGAIAPSASFASFFGDHPRYLHAISDLRYARSLILRPDAPNVQADEQNAVRELDAALGEVKQAARDDWKPVSDRQPIDAKLDRRGRLHEALKVMDRAHGDIDKEEDDHAARGLRNRALGHLDQARNFVRKAIGDKEFDQHL